MVYYTNLRKYPIVNRLKLTIVRVVEVKGKMMIYQKR